MKIKISSLLACLCLNIIFCFAQDKTFQVVDSKTDLPIPYVFVSFGENGIYSDDLGRIDIASVTSDTLKIFHPYYQEKLVLIDSLETIVKIEPLKEEKLDEIVISNKPIKFKNEKHKLKTHNQFIYSTPIVISGEFVSLIKLKKDYLRVKLVSVDFPIITKYISSDLKYMGKKQISKKKIFSTLYRLKIYSVENEKPGHLIDIKELTIKITGDSKTITVDLEKYDITIPQNGIFIGLENLGSLDDKDALITENTSNTYTNKEGKLINYGKNTKPYFPLESNKEGFKTFFRNKFGDGSWTLYRKDEEKTIPIGYKISYN